MTCATASRPAQQFAAVCAILDRFAHDPAKLISILQAVQTAYRHLPQEVLSFVATDLGLSPARVYGVATFYAHFALEPKGRFVIKVCDGTACHVKDSIPLFDALHQHLHLRKNQHTTDDMRFTLEKVSCLGACGLAPVLVINDAVHGQMTPAKATAAVLAIERSPD